MKEGLTMTYTEFRAIEIGDKVKNGSNARTRTVTFVYDDPCGARIINTSKIRGCTKSIDNLDAAANSHYSNWRVVTA